MVQFPQSNGGAVFFMKDVKFDPEAHYDVISMKKLEVQSHIPIRLVLNPMKVSGVGGAMYLLWDNDPFLVTSI